MFKNKLLLLTFLLCMLPFYVFGMHELNKNFIARNLKQAANGVTEFTVVENQIDTPTFAKYLAGMALGIFAYNDDGETSVYTESTDQIIHYSGGRAMSRKDFLLDVLGRIYPDKEFKINEINPNKTQRPNGGLESYDIYESMVSDFIKELG